MKELIGQTERDIAPEDFKYYGNLGGNFVSKCGALQIYMEEQENSDFSWSFLDFLGISREVMKYSFIIYYNLVT